MDRITKQMISSMNFNVNSSNDSLFKYIFIIHPSYCKIRYSKRYDYHHLYIVIFQGGINMSILRRFRDIMASNINALLDKAEDPEKMIDQYLRNLNRDLGQVKSETATIMAEEQRAKRSLNECQADINKMQEYAIKALESENEDDARKFLERKATLTTKETELKTTLELAEANSVQMRQMHDKLVKDIEELQARSAMLKGKAAVAKTQKRMNEIGTSVTGANQSISAFDKMEDRVNQSLDEAQAMSELNRSSEDDMKDLAAKYEKKVDVNDELAALKEQIANKDE